MNTTTLHTFQPWTVSSGSSAPTCVWCGKTDLEGPHGLAPFPFGVQADPRHTCKHGLVYPDCSDSDCYTVRIQTRSGPP